MSQEGNPPQEVYRQGLSTAAAAVCLECGFDSVKNSALETLTELLQSYLTEIARSTRQYCEVGGRAIPTLCDVQAALADVGFKMSSLPEYIRRPKRVAFGDVHKSAPTTNPNVLLVGERKNFPAYIPENSKYPKFPDPHTYVRTLTGQESEEQYGILREKSSLQKWDVERALTRFIAKTGSSHPLLPDDRNAFPLIAATPSPIPYHAALLPSENENLLQLTEKDSTQESTSESEVEQYEGNESNKGAKPKKSSGQKHKLSKKGRLTHESPKNFSNDAKTDDRSAENIDNPYLRPAKTPKMKKRQR